MTPIVKTSLWSEDVGYPTPGLNPTRFKLVFTKLPLLELFCNEIALPEIIIGAAQQQSTKLTFKHVGEKLNYSSFTCNFILDKELLSYKHIYDWMYRLSVQGFNSDIVSDCTLSTDGIDFKFENVFPVRIGSISFDSKITDVIFPSCEVTFECDRYYPI